MPEPAATRDDILRWRSAERTRLLALRQAMSADARHEAARAIERQLDLALGDLAGAGIGVYWPIKGEANLRPWMERLHERGARCALPVVTERAQPLVFRAWGPGAVMARGFWGIPEPAEGPTVVPDILVAPMVGFDASAYRLGYGGGYYDRSLAVRSPRPLVVGVAFAFSRIATICPLAHDIPMDLVVTEQGLAVDRRRGRP